VQAENTKGLNRGYTSWFNWSRVSKDTKSITPIGKYLTYDTSVEEINLFYTYTIYIYIWGGQTVSREPHAARVIDFCGSQLILTFLQTIFLI